MTFMCNRIWCQHYKSFGKDDILGLMQFDVSRQFHLKKEIKQPVIYWERVMVEQFTFTSFNCKQILLFRKNFNNRNYHIKVFGSNTTSYKFKVRIFQSTSRFAESVTLDPLVEFLKNLQVSTKSNCNANRKLFSV